MESTRTCYRCAIAKPDDQFIQRVGSTERRWTEGRCIGAFWP